MQITENKYRDAFANPILWGIFALYAIVLGFTIIHHELWGDELHSWNIAKASKSFFNLISNTRYEGHPPLWYILLWVVSKFTHDVSYIQLVQFMIANAVVFLVLFYSPFSVLIKALIPFGYFFLFEYGVISRNYAIAVLLAFSICILLHRNFKQKLFLYYALLFLLSNTHLLAMLLAVSLHFYFLLAGYTKNKNKANLLVHALIGIVILLPSLYFIFPPPDSSLGADFWLQRWNIKQSSVIVKAPLRAFIPIPAWWDYHFWNTEFLVQAQKKWSFIKWINLLLSGTLLLLSLAILGKNKKAFFFFISYLLLLLVIYAILPFSNARQTGFIYIAFLTALWFYYPAVPPTSRPNRIIIVLLIIQVIAGAFAVIKDIKLPFSNSSRVKELAESVPRGNEIVTDYWCLNTLSAFMDKEYYCVDLQKQVSYLLWTRELGKMIQAPSSYSNGMNRFFREKKLTRCI